MRFDIKRMATIKDLMTCEMGCKIKLKTKSSN